MEIYRAKMEDMDALVGLALKLWPGHTAADLEEDMTETMGGEDAAFFLARSADAAVGFAQCQLRRDYVEGTHSSPVGYLEGVYVAEGFREQGAARALLKACENWAKSRGCQEFASDCELDNTQSLHFHLNVGFREANRIICFTKQL